MIQCISNLLNGSIQDWWLMKGYKPRVRYANVFTSFWYNDVNARVSGNYIKLSKSMML